MARLVARRLRGRRSPREHGSTTRVQRNANGGLRTQADIGSNPLVTEPVTGTPMEPRATSETVCLPSLGKPAVWRARAHSNRQPLDRSAARRARMRKVLHDGIGQSSGGTGGLEVKDDV